MALNKGAQWFFLLLFSLGCISCGPSKSAGGKDGTTSRPSGAAEVSMLKMPHLLFPLEDAVQILGEAASMTDSIQNSDTKLARYQCSYHAKKADSGKLGAVYFALEQYHSLEAAHEKYTFIKKANQDHGIETVEDLGDEAYFHTDGTNFYFMMVREANKVLSMKVNKITRHTSKTAFFAVATKITDAM
jgi:hypothetical protein